MCNERNANAEYNLIQIQIQNEMAKGKLLERQISNEDLAEEFFKQRNATERLIHDELARNHEEGEPEPEPTRVRVLDMTQLPKLGKEAVIAIAAVAHEANRQYCQLLGDISQAPWDTAPVWQKDSAILGVEKILDGTIKQPSGSHESWAAQKVADGWKYGPVKDPEKKEHPCLVPFDELPATQRFKDTIFFATVQTMSALLSSAQTL